MVLSCPKEEVLAGIKGILLLPHQRESLDWLSQVSVLVWLSQVSVLVWFERTKKKILFSSLRSKNMHVIQGAKRST